MTNLTAIENGGKGVAAAFEYLYKAHCRRVYSLCYRMIKNPAEAEDLTQQAFLQLFRKISTFRGESGFSTWLHRVTVNIVLMHLRRKKPVELLSEDFEGRTPSGESPSEHSSCDTSMFGTVERLNPGLLGCSTGSSKSQLHKARKRLRRLLQGEQVRAEAAGVVPA